MGGRFSDSRHIVRLAVVFVAGAAAFLALRALLVPEGFGELGHYRPAALGDNRAGPLVYAGREACRDCHEDVAEANSGGNHAGVGCEACHGALAAHAADPGEAPAQRPDPAVLCLRCHGREAARPAAFPQVDAGHGEGGACLACHHPHPPRTEEGPR